MTRIVDDASSKVPPAVHLRILPRLASVLRGEAILVSAEVFTNEQRKPGSVSTKGFHSDMEPSSRTIAADFGGLP
jgi:hypothetical protein